MSAYLATSAYRREQKSKRTENKQKLYSSLQHSVFTLWAAKGVVKEEVKALSEISDAWIFASDPVLVQLNMFMQECDDYRRKEDSKEDSKKTRDEQLQPIVAELYLLMRKDLFSEGLFSNIKTKLTSGEAKKSVKFYPWVGIPGK